MNVSRIRGDRIAAMEAELRACGVLESEGSRHHHPRLRTVSTPPPRRSRPQRPPCGDEPCGAGAGCRAGTFHRRRLRPCRRAGPHFFEAHQPLGAEVGICWIKTKRYLIVGLRTAGRQIRPRAFQSRVPVDGIPPPQRGPHSTLSTTVSRPARPTIREDLVSQADHIIFGLYPGLIDWFKTYGHHQVRLHLLPMSPGVKTGLVGGKGHVSGGVWVHRQPPRWRGVETSTSSTA